MFQIVLKKHDGESPLLVDGKIIFPIGAQDAAIVALDVENGNISWANHRFRADYASPILVEFANSSQVVCHMEDEVVSVDPVRGS